MQEQKHSALWADIDVVEYDMITIERRARELRARAIADVFGGFFRWVMRKLHIARPAMRDKAA